MNKLKKYYTITKALIDENILIEEYIDKVFQVSGYKSDITDPECRLTDVMNRVKSDILLIVNMRKIENNEAKEHNKYLLRYTGECSDLEKLDDIYMELSKKIMYIEIKASNTIKMLDTYMEYTEEHIQREERIKDGRV